MKKNKKKVFEKITDEIEELIRNGYLKAGDFLPSERSLAKKLGVGRVSLREALHYLQNRGVVVTIPGEGTKIVADNINNLGRSFSEAIILSRLISLDLVEAREVIEVKNACFAAERATKTDVKTLGEILGESYKALLQNDEVKQEKLDYKFHYAITKATHNVVLVKIFSSISKIMQEHMTQRRIVMLIDTAYARLVYEQHASIYAAIKKGQCNEASQLMFHHLEEFLEKCITIKLS